MATLAEVVDGVYRDLSDEGDPRVFTIIQVEDFIRGGIADLNRAAPPDVIHALALETDVDTGIVNKFDYDVPVELPYRVEVFSLADDQSFDLTEPVDGWVGTGGYTYRVTPTGGSIIFPRWWLRQFDAANFGIRIHGYSNRPLPYTVEGDPSPEVGLSEKEVFSVRAYARAAGFDLLAHDRSLFAQWQGQTNNTDVSPTQMMQMASSAKGEWDHHRGGIRVIRKYW
jgi:hypothetical protein